VKNGNIFSFSMVLNSALFAGFGKEDRVLLDHIRALAIRAPYRGMIVFLHRHHQGELFPALLTAILVGGHDGLLSNL
jgi:predicted permease